MRSPRQFNFLRATARIGRNRNNAFDRAGGSGCENYTERTLAQRWNTQSTGSRSGRCDRVISASYNAADVKSDTLIVGQRHLDRIAARSNRL